MTARVYHWKHGWIPLDRAATLNKAHKAPAPVVTDRAEKSTGDVLAAAKGGGFTYHPKKGLLQVGRDKGFAVAIPHTEEIVGKGNISREDFARGFAKVLQKYHKQLAKGAVIGGWYSEDRDVYMVELTEIHDPADREGAIKLGKQRNQEGIFDLATGEYIDTGGTGG